MTSYIKVGAILVLLLILVVGSLLQIYDCFNDSPNLDQDALLHTMDAFFSIAMSFVLGWILLCVLAICWVIQGPLRRPQFSSSIPSSVQPTPSPEPQASALRI